MGKKIKNPATEISPEQEKELLRLVRTHNTPQKLALRANFILAAAMGESHTAIA